MNICTSFYILMPAYAFLQVPVNVDDDSDDFDDNDDDDVDDSDVGDDDKR